MVGVRVRTEEDLKQLGRSLLLLAVSPVDRASNLVLSGGPKLGFRASRGYMKR